MAGQFVTLLCYWGGQMKDGTEGIEYDGASPRVLRVCSDCRINELTEKIYGITGWDRSLYELEMVCRYLVAVNPKQFIPLAIVDEASIDAMFDMIRAPIAKLACIQLYLERKPTSHVHAPPITRSGLQSVGPSTQNVDMGTLFDINNDVGNAVNLEAIPEMVANEDRNVSSLDAQINNDLVGDEEDEEDEEMLRNESEAPCEEDEVHNDIGAGSSRSLHEEPLGEELYVGQRFANKEEIKQTVKEYHIKRHQQFKVTKSTRELLSLKCKQAPQCPWSLRASVRSATKLFQISTLKGPHTCLNPIIRRDHVQLDSGFVANFILTTVKADLTVNIGAIIAIVAQRFNYNISYRKAWVAKQKAIVRLFGDWEDSYKALPSFMDAMQRANPGTAVVWVKEPAGRPGEEIFKRVFWAFGPAIEGFKHCRPVISIDGTHLYGKYKGKLLVAVATDANDQLFPLAFAITEGETNETWSWFMACLREKVTNRSGLCVISDRCKGIMHTMRQQGLGWTEPLAYHRYCIRHMASNFNSAFKDKNLKNKIYKMAREHQLRKFNRMLGEIENIHDGDVRRWLDNVPLASWALAHDGGRRYGMMTTNMSEIFNSVLKGVCFLPITALVQFTFYRVNNYFVVRRELGKDRLAQGAFFTPSIEVKLQACKEKAIGHEVNTIHHRPGYFEVKTAMTRVINGPPRGGNGHIVDLYNKTCSCQKWTIYHYPCSHVMAVCAFQNLNAMQFVDDFYSITQYVNTWASTFHPIPDKSTWPVDEGPTLVPDQTSKRNSKGRPQCTRLHNEMDARDSRTQTTCGICKEIGHNRRSCPNKNRFVQTENTT